jgi:hypothetical protein
LTATATTDAPKTKRSRTPMTYQLVAIQKNADGEIISWNAVPQPEISKANPTRADYKRAVRKALEDGKNAADYNGKQLTVIGFPEPFCFKAEVETVEIRKVNITES